MTLRLPVPRSNKYRAIRTTVEGHTFDSKREAGRFLELRYLEKAGEIRELELQPKFPLSVVNPENGHVTDLGAYYGDFAYVETASQRRVIEDVKSPATLTQLCRWKLKHVRAQYGIDVRLT